MEEGTCNSNLGDVDHTQNGEDGVCACGRPLNLLGVHVTPTTGGQFQLRVAATDSVEFLRRLISRKLRVPKERICLLFRDKHLREGSLEENSIVDGARITLLPSVETGLLTQRPEQSVMQALESLNDGQVNDFLSGKAPLNLTMRLGDHMMLIQLQLSTVSPGGTRKSKVPSHSQSHSHTESLSSTPHFSHHHIPSYSASQMGISPSHSAGTSSTTSTPSPVYHHRHVYHDHNLSGSCSPPHSSSYMNTPPHHHYHHYHHRSNISGSPPSPCSSSSNSPVGSPLMCPLDSELPIRGCPHRSDQVDPCASLDTKALAEASRNLTQTLKQLSSEVLTTKPVEREKQYRNAARPEKSTSSPQDSSASETPEGHFFSTSSKSSSTSSSSECSLGEKPSGSPNPGVSLKRQGAIIESMHHHGKGVYSGTFSGTLNPALQDSQGRPKRDISTIIHILNDLLCATPQYRRHSSSPSPASPSVGHPSTRWQKYSSSRMEDGQNCTKKARIDKEDSSPPSHKAVSPTLLLDNKVEPPDTESRLYEEQMMRSKVEQLRLIMGQRRARRKAKRESNSSFGGTSAGWSSEATTLVASTATATAAGSAAAGGAGKEEDDQTSLCELNSGTVVA